MFNQLTENQQKLLIDIKSKIDIQFYYFKVNNPQCSKDIPDWEQLESLGYIKIEKTYHKNNLSLKNQVWKITITEKILPFIPCDVNSYSNALFSLAKQLDNQEINKLVS